MGGRQSVVKEEIDFEKEPEEVQEEILSLNHKDKVIMAQASYKEKTARPLVIFGNHMIGKTMFVKMLLTRLNVDNKDVHYGKTALRTTGVEAFTIDQPVVFPSGGTHSVAIYDTEGFNRVQILGKVAPVAQFDPKVFSFVHAMPGVLIYMTSTYGIPDEQMLLIMSGFVETKRRIFVIHNTNCKLNEKEHVITTLKSANNVPIKEGEDGSLTSYLCGHIINHLLMFHHSGDGATHNSRLIATILKVLESVDPVSLHTHIMEAKAKRKLFKSGDYYFSFQTESKSLLEVNFRNLSDSEIEDPENKIEGDPKNYQIIKLFGNFNLNSFEIATKSGAHDDKFIEISLCGRGNDRVQGRVMKVVMWTPVVIFNPCYVRRIVENECIFIVTSRASCSPKPHENSASPTSRSPEASSSKGTKGPEEKTSSADGGEQNDAYSQV